MKMSARLALPFVLFLAMSVSPYTGHGSLNIQVTNVQEQKGTLVIALFPDEQTFDKEQPALFQKVSVGKTGAIPCTFPKVPYGKWVVAVYHDLNNNGSLDKNLAGVPKEPYGFSNGIKSKWRKPKFDENAFKIDAPNKKMDIKINYWGDL
jgi:uncharacterized protein (DUF2141 family)